jgi:DNA-binding transcriptional ArsR family regulator
MPRSARHHALDILGDPARRRILELLSEGEMTSGAVVTVLQKEFGITQAAVSQHLRVLRDGGFVAVRAEGTRRIYAIDPAPFQQVDAWLESFRHFWTRHLAALGTEIARGKKERRAVASTAMKGKAKRRA